MKFSCVVCWSPVSRASDQSLDIISSNSKGQLHLLKVDAAGPGLQCVATWQAHHFEAWIAAFNYWQTEVVYSGGCSSGCGCPVAITVPLWRLEGGVSSRGVATTLDTLGH